MSGYMKSLNFTSGLESNSGLATLTNMILCLKGTISSTYYEKLNHDILLNVHLLT